MIHSLSLNAKARRHLATRGMAELRTATTWNDVGLQGRIHERIERKSVKRMHRVGRGPPHAHFRRTHVSARTLLALYNQARLAYLEKAKRLASAESHLCVRPGWFRATALAEPRPEHSTLGLPRVTTSTFGRRAARALRHTRPSTAGQSWLRITPQLASGSPWRKPHFR